MHFFYFYFCFAHLSIPFVFLLVDQFYLEFEGKKWHQMVQVTLLEEEVELKLGLMLRGDILL